MAKTIILIHGRATKPKEAALRAGWIEALRHGLERDRPDALPMLDGATTRFVYYGDVSNAYLDPNVDTEAKATSRVATLERLKQYRANEFTRETYEQLDGQTSFKEAAADAFAGALALFRVSEPVIHAVAPDMTQYWNADSQFGSDVRFPIIAPLKEAMDADDEILVIAHSLGSMIAYDTFWKFSHMGEYRPDYTDKKIDLWITLGSPLGDETVKRHLKGDGLKDERRYPTNVRRWVNLAAEDDYISHDQAVADDFRRMLDLGIIDSIEDRRVYNLAVRNGRSNPHHGPGYLVTPEVAELVADWLAS